MGLAHPADIERDHPILALKPLAPNRPEEMPAMPTPTIPARQEGGFVRIKKAAVAAMARLALRERRAREVAPHGAPTEAHLLSDGVQRPAPLMEAPDLLVGGDPLGPPGGGERQCPCGGLRGRERYGGMAGVGGQVGGVVHRWWCREVLGSDARQLRGVGPEHVGQRVREVLPQVKPIRHLTGRGRSEARRFGVGFRAIPPKDFNPGMCLQPLGHGLGFPIREPGERAPLCEVQQQRAVGVALAQGEIIDAEHPWGAHRRAGSATDHP